MPGRNAIVRIATVFIAMLSLPVTSAIFWNPAQLRHSNYYPVELGSCSTALGIFSVMLKVNVQAIQIGTYQCQPRLASSLEVLQTHKNILP